MAKNSEISSTDHTDRDGTKYRITVTWKKLYSGTPQMLIDKRIQSIDVDRWDGNNWARIIGDEALLVARQFGYSR